MPDLTPAEFKQIKEGVDAAHRALVELSIQLDPYYYSLPEQNELRASVDAAKGLMDEIEKVYREHRR